MEKLVGFTLVALVALAWPLRGAFCEPGAACSTSVPIDYPSDGSHFHRGIKSPTFVWLDAAARKALGRVRGQGDGRLEEQLRSDIARHEVAAQGR